MTKILILEDEIPARKKLKRFIAEVGSPTEIIAELDTVESAVEFLKQQRPDLIFSDIELLDGNAFEIYRQISVSCPIIFTTAYDQYWMAAFEENGIDYLLKPFTKERFQKAWNKFMWYENSTSAATHQLEVLTKIIAQNFQNKVYKKHFTIHKNKGIYLLETKDVLLFEANQGVIFAHDAKGNAHLLTETTLIEIEKKLNPEDFFRINRSELIQKGHIEKIERYTKNALAIKLKGFTNYLKTSQSQTALFREWLEK